MARSFRALLRRASVALLATCLLAPSAVSHADAPVTFDYGVACGDMTSTEAVLWTRTSAAAILTPELLDASGATLATLPSVETTVDSDFTVKAVATDLPPGTPL